MAVVTAYIIARSRITPLAKLYFLCGVSDILVVEVLLLYMTYMTKSSTCGIVGFIKKLGKLRQYPGPLGNIADCILKI